MCENVINQCIKDAINEKNLTLNDIAEGTYIDQTTLWRLRNGQTKKPDKILSLSRYLNTPELISTYLYEDDPIMSKLGFIPLNNIDRSKAVMLFRAKIETEEFIDKFESMAITCMNKQSSEDFSKDETELFFKGFQEMLDVQHCFWEILLETIKIFGFQKVFDEIDKHNEKCKDRNYTKKNVLQNAVR